MLRWLRRCSDLRPILKKSIVNIIVGIHDRLFQIWEPEHLSIYKLNEVWNRRLTDFDTLKLRKSELGMKRGNLWLALIFMIWYTEKEKTPFLLCLLHANKTENDRYYFCFSGHLLGYLVGLVLNLWTCGFWVETPNYECLLLTVKGSKTNKCWKAAFFRLFEMVAATHFYRENTLISKLRKTLRNGRLLKRISVNFSLRIQLASSFFSSTWLSTKLIFCSRSRRSNLSL